MSATASGERKRCTDTNNGHSTGSHITNKRDRSQCTSGEHFVAIDLSVCQQVLESIIFTTYNVLVGRNENGENAIAEKDRRSERRPDTNAAVTCPSHPEKRDWDRRCAEHGKDEAEFGFQTFWLSCIAKSLELLLRLGSDIWNER